MNTECPTLMVVCYGDQQWAEDGWFPGSVEVDPAVMLGSKLFLVEWGVAMNVKRVP